MFTVTLERAVYIYIYIYCTVKKFIQYTMCKQFLSSLAISELRGVFAVSKSTWVQGTSKAFKAAR